MRSSFKNKRKMAAVLLVAFVMMPATTILSDISSGENGGSFGESGEIIWVYDTDLYVKHVETTDLNGDGIKDVIAGEYYSDGYDTPSKVYGIDGADGSTLWSYQLDDGVRSMTLGDINNDGVMDVIAGASKGTSTPDGKVHAIDGTDGSVIWVFTPGSSGDTNGDVAVGDFDGDEYPDVAVACWDDYVYAINGSNGEELWSTHIGSIFVNAVDTGDVNGDGIDDVAFAHSYLTGYDNYQGVLDGTDGSFIWSQTVDYEVQNVILSDIDDDGYLEAVFGVFTDTDEVEIHVRDAANGNLEWSYTLGSAPGYNPDVFLFSYDIDNDGDLDLVVGNEYVDNYIYAFDGDSSTPMWISEELSGYPRDLAFGDVNGNGYNNIIAATYDRVQVLNATDGKKDWYYPVAGTIRGAACADLDNDGTKDVVCSGGADFSGSNPAESVWALKTVEESFILWEFDVEEYGNALRITDLTGDQYMDVVAVTSNDKVWAINGEDGAELWHWTSNDNLYSVATGDFNGDSQIDVAVGGSDNRVTALDGADGSQLWQFAAPSDQIPRRCLQATDLNNDGKDDVVVGSDDGNIYAINGNTGSELWSVAMGGDIEEIELAQMDDSGPLDVVAAVGWSGNKAVVIDGSDGSILWEYTENTDYAKHVETLDVNNDNILDLVVGIPKMGATPGRIIMVDGDTHQALWTANTPIGYEYSLSHGDLNNDGIPDVVVAGDSDSKKVYAYDGTDGTELWWFTANGEVNTVQVYDVDDDGSLDVVAGSDDQYVYVLCGNDGVNMWSYITADDVIHIQIGDISGNGKPNIAALTFGFDGIVYAFTTLVGMIPLQADADGPYEGMVNSSIQFHGSAFGGTPPYTWHWDFDDGTTSDEQNPEHTYTTSGSYTATLTVTDNTGNFSVDTTTVEVFAELQADADGPYSGSIGQPVQFYGSATGGKAPYTWHWDFGDGYTADVQNPKHYYSTPGVHNVTLTVTDSCGYQDNDTTNVTITPEPLEADANGPYEGTVGEPIEFHGSATGGTPPYTYH
ncbi:MAG TPA: PKD domain-containing protein, partial [Thermoplasmatales archaeon]|nr:PKD domain-containing protein [Thermoplasmatales archaeon]